MVSQKLRTLGQIAELTIAITVVSYYLSRERLFFQLELTAKCLDRARIEELRTFLNEAELEQAQLQQSLKDACYRLIGVA